MAGVNLSINDELDKEFRDESSRRVGMKKGNIQIAVEEDVSDWINKKITCFLY
jgi:hypothetical protein